MSSLEYRKQRMTDLAQAWQATKVNDLFIQRKVPDDIFNNLKRSIGVYIAKALHFEYTPNEAIFIRRLESRRHDRSRRRRQRP